jgi:hypothetical protein
VLKSQMKELLEQERANAKDIAEVIEEERAKVEARTPITEEVGGGAAAGAAGGVVKQGLLLLVVGLEGGVGVAWLALLPACIIWRV